MKTVHKLVLQPWINKYVLPYDANILHFGWQGDDLCAWYHVDCSPEGDSLCTGKPFFLNVVPTGIPFSNGRYIGTAVKPGLVFHLFQDYNYIEGRNG
jgi:hypothetical protein